MALLLNMRAYIALSYNHRDQLRPVISTVQSVLQSVGVDPFTFVYEKDFSSEQSHEMMEAARKELDRAERRSILQRSVELRQYISFTQSLQI